MPKYLIERNLEGAGKLTQTDLTGISQKSNAVLDGLGGRAQWLQTFVTDDALVCLYIADSPESVKEHAVAGGFPCDNIRQVRTIIDPTTAEV